MGLARSFALCILLLVLPFRLAVGQEVPVPPLTGPVIDQVGVLPPQARQELERELWALKREKGSEVVVLIVPSTKPEEIEQFSMRVVDTWKIGRKGIDDGALLLVAVNDRRVRIEVGRGLEGDVPDVKAFRMIDEIIVPRFRQGDLQGGIVAGASALVGLIRGIDLPAPKRGGEEANSLYLFVTVVGYVIGAFVEGILGLLVGAGIGGAVAFILGYLLLSAASGIGLGVVVAVLVLFLGSIGPSMRGGGRSRYRSWDGGWSSGGSYGGGSFGGGSFGSGGSFSGGGSSGEVVMRRLVRHAVTGRWHLSKMLSGGASQAITDAVRDAEQGHSGQIRVVIEGTPGVAHVVQGRTARDRAIDLFASERVWDTKHNNGVLLYLMIAERDAEIVADRGLNTKVSAEQWHAICTDLERDVKTSGFTQAVCSAVSSIGRLLREHFPAEGAPNELSDDVVIRRG